MNREITKKDIRNANGGELLDIARELMSTKDFGYEIEELLTQAETNYRQVTGSPFPYQRKQCVNCTRREVFKPVKYSDGSDTVCEPCYDRLNAEFDEEYR